MAGLLLFVNDKGVETPVEVSPDATIRDLAAQAGLSDRDCVFTFADQEFLTTSDELLADTGIGQQARIYVKDCEIWKWKDNLVEGTDGSICKGGGNSYWMTRCATKLQEGNRICLRAEIIKQNDKVHDFGLITDAFEFESKQRSWQSSTKDGEHYFIGSRIGKAGNYLEMELDGTEVAWYKSTGQGSRTHLRTITIPSRCFPLTPVVQTYDSGVNIKISSQPFGGTEPETRTEQEEKGSECTESQESTEEAPQEIPQEILDVLGPDYDKEKIRTALRRSGGNIERAINSLLDS